MAGDKSKHFELTEESGRNRDICRRCSDEEIKGMVIVLLNRQHISTLFA